MRFLVDMPLSPALARWLADQGHDAVHAAEIGLQKVADSEIVEIARREKRIVITADLDYPRLLALISATEPSLILFRGGDWSDADVIARFGSCSSGWGIRISNAPLSSLSEIACGEDASRSAVETYVPGFSTSAIQSHM